MENSKKKKRKRKNSRLTLSSSARLSQFRGYIYLEKDGKKKKCFMRGKRAKEEKAETSFSPCLPRATSLSVLFLRSSWKRLRRSKHAPALASKQKRRQKKTLFHYTFYLFIYNDSTAESPHCVNLRQTSERKAPESKTCSYKRLNYKKKKFKTSATRARTVILFKRKTVIITNKHNAVGSSGRKTK